MWKRINKEEAKTLSHDLKLTKRGKLPDCYYFEYGKDGISILRCEIRDTKEIVTNFKWVDI